MSQNSSFAITLRFIGIVLMALTGGFTLLGGIGTTCAALFPTKFGSMAALAPFQWLYILFVLVGVGIGVWGIWATIKLVKGKSDAYQQSIMALVSGTLIGLLHIYMSRMLRGSSMPVDAVVYTTVLTLVVFLLFRIPGIWQRVNFDKTNNRTAGGAAAIILGIMALTIQYTMGSTHTWGGVNYADAFNTGMTITGIGLLLLGVGFIFSMDKIRVLGNRPEVETRSV